jgi:hypothetical protein
MLNVVSLLAPWVDYFSGTELFDPTTPGVHPDYIETITEDGQVIRTPVTKDMVTGAVVRVPVLDATGLRALVGRTACDDHGKARWVTIIQATTATNLNLLAGTEMSEDTMNEKIQQIEQKYVWEMGYVWGASSQTVVDDSVAAAASANMMVDWAVAGAESGAAWGGRALGEIAGGPPGAIMGGMVLGKSLSPLIEWGADAIRIPPDYEGQNRSASEIATGVLKDWYDYYNTQYEDLGLKPLDTSNIANVNVVEEKLADGYVAGTGSVSLNHVLNR